MLTVADYRGGAGSRRAAPRSEPSQICLVLARLLRRASSRVKVRDVIKLLERDGWVWVSSTGGHRQFKHPSKPGRVTVSGKPSADLHPKTTATILRQAGLR